jgi:hypothetical protein
MIFFPFVDIYYQKYQYDNKNIPQAIERYLLYYGDKILSREFLTSFKYTSRMGAEDAGDSATIVLSFPFNNINLTHLSRGTFLYIEWGYRDSVRKGEQFAVDDLKINYSKSGFILTLELISIAEFLAKNESYSDTIGGMLKEHGLTLEYTRLDPVTKKTTKVVITRKDWSIEIQGFPVHKLWDRKRALQEAEGADELKYGKEIWVTDKDAPPIYMGVEGYIRPRVKIIEFQKDHAYQTLFELMVEYAMKSGKGSLIAMNGNRCIISEDQRDAPPAYLFSVSPNSSAPLISVRIEQPKKEIEHENMEILTIDGTDKVIVLDSLEAFGTSLINMGDLSGEVEVLKSGDSLFYKITEGDESYLLPLTPEQKKDFYQTTALYELFGEAIYEEVEDEGPSRRRVKDEYYGESGRKILEAREVYRIGTDFYADDDPRNLPKHVDFRINSSGTPLGVNAAKARELHHYYSRLAVRVTIAGTPGIELGRTFIVKDCANFVDGLYFCMEITHSITRGSYTTEIVGTRIPAQVGLKESLLRAFPHGEVGEVSEEEIQKGHRLANEVFLPYKDMEYLHLMPWIMIRQGQDPSLFPGRYAPESEATLPTQDRLGGQQTPLPIVPIKGERLSRAVSNTYDFLKGEGVSDPKIIVDRIDIQTQGRTNPDPPPIIVRP